MNEILKKIENRMYGKISSEYEEGFNEALNIAKRIVENAFNGVETDVNCMLN